MTGGKARQRRSRCSVFTLLVHVIFQAAAATHGGTRLTVSTSQAEFATEQSRTEWVVPHGVPHHIYKENVSAVESWTPCHPDAYPPGAWVSRTSGGHQSGLGSHLYGTAKVQRFIWMHQHPSNCSTAKFLLYTPIASGIGSIFHQMGQALALAIELQRVLVIAYTPEFPYYSTARCGMGVSFEACYFEPLSSCSWRDASEGITDNDSIPRINSPSQVTDPALKTVQMSGHFTASDYHCQAVPPQFHSLLRRGPINWDKKHYWWRAQSVAYIVRPNPRTLAELAARKRRTYPGRQIRRGTISVHVRHGDKHVESPSIPDEAYLAQAEQMARSGALGWTGTPGQAGALGQAMHTDQNRQSSQSRQSIQIRQQAGARPPIFLSTEDPSTIEFFARQSLWDVSYANVTRKPDVERSTLSYVAEIGGYEEMLNSLVNLDLALECDAWIGTLSSNWCRLIDELRATVRCKAHGSYLDAEQQNPPQDLNW